MELLPPTAERRWTVMTMTRREQLLECRRKIDEGMMAAGTVDHVSQLDVPKLLWWLCKAVLLLIEKDLKRGEG